MATDISTDSEEASSNSVQASSNSCSEFQDYDAMEQPKLASLCERYSTRLDNCAQTIEEYEEKEKSVDELKTSFKRLLGMFHLLGQRYHSGDFNNNCEWPDSNVTVQRMLYSLPNPCTIFMCDFLDYLYVVFL